jgi:hypothetical protein
MNGRITLPQPPHLVAELLSDERLALAISGPYGEALAIYHAPTATAAVFTAAAGCWSAWSPIGFDAFVDGIGGRFSLRESPQFEEWAAACRDAGAAWSRVPRH